MKTTYIGMRTDYSGVHTVYHQSHIESRQAQFAMDLMRHFALVAASDDGEDSAGRAKLRTLSAEEVAQKACELAAAAYNEFHERGWLIEVPMYTDEQVKKILGRGED